MYLLRATPEQLDAVLYDTQGLTLWPAGGTVAKGSRSIRAGDILARDTSTKKFLVAKRSAVSAAASSSVSISVDDAHPFESGDLLSIGTDSVTVASVNYDSNILTLTAGITAADNDLVTLRGTTNNREKAVGVALLPVRDKDAALLGGLDDVTPKLGDEQYGAIAITGRFKYGKLRNFDTSIGSSFHAELAGRNQVDIGSDGGVYIISTVPATFDD